MRFGLLRAFASQVRPVRGLGAFLVGITKAAAYSVNQRRLVNPARFLEQDVVVKSQGDLYLLNRETSFGYYLLLDVLEPETLRVMNSIRGELFVDVGANAGGYEVRLAKHFGHVIAVEPIFSLAAIVSQNAVLNQLRNVEVLNCAIYSTSGRQKLYAHGDYGQLYSLVRPSSTYTCVETRTLDQITSGFEGVDLLKIDAEGAELEILKGGVLTLQKTEHVVIEVGPGTSELVSKTLQASGFTLQMLDSRTSAVNSWPTGNLYGARYPLT
jgi:FkbM family methyltransferase